MKRLLIVVIGLLLIEHGGYATSLQDDTAVRDHLGILEKSLVEKGLLFSRCLSLSEDINVGYKEMLSAFEAWKNQASIAYQAQDGSHPYVRALWLGSIAEHHPEKQLFWSNLAQAAYSIITGTSRDTSRDADYMNRLESLHMDCPGVANYYQWALNQNYTKRSFADLLNMTIASTDKISIDYIKIFKTVPQDVFDKEYLWVEQYSTMLAGGTGASLASAPKALATMAIGGALSSKQVSTSPVSKNALAAISAIRQAVKA